MIEQQSSDIDIEQRPQLPLALLRPEAYPHEVESIELIETLLSWVFLTGEFAYKVKKPVHFDYVDFSTLERRKHFCEEELRCNRAFAPELYLAVTPIVRTADHSLAICSAEESTGLQIVDFAVKMREFPQSAQADNLLAEGKLERDALRQFGGTLALQHAQLPQISSPVDVATPMLNNFSTLLKLVNTVSVTQPLQQLRESTRNDLSIAEQTLNNRHREGFTRECHGDLHLQNLILTDSGMRAFDCLEFDASLRIIDVWNDAAFLVMDCCAGGRQDLGYAFVDGYLNATGDYDGVTLLPLYVRYRAMVRAKVAALRHAQTSEQQDFEALKHYVTWTHLHQQRPPGRLIINCGVSGSGKSYWAEQLVPELAAIRLRSDILRKRLYGMAPDAHSHSPLQAGLYGSSQTKATYEKLATLTTALLKCGENVIVDCTNLHFWQRKLFYQAADDAGADSLLLHLTASRPLLEQRIRQRQAAGNDASEADLHVLEQQLTGQELPRTSEPVVEIDTECTDLRHILDVLQTFTKGPVS